MRILFVLLLTVYQVAGVEAIATYMNSSKIIVNKSSVLPGTGAMVAERISEVLKSRNVQINFCVVSNSGNDNVT